MRQKKSLRRQSAARELRGMVAWEGDLELSREFRDLQASTRQQPDKTKSTRQPGSSRVKRSKLAK